MAPRRPMHAAQGIARDPAVGVDAAACKEREQLFGPSRSHYQCVERGCHGVELDRAIGGAPQARVLCWPNG